MTQAERYKKWMSVPSNKEKARIWSRDRMRQRKKDPELKKIDYERSKANIARVVAETKLLQQQAPSYMKYLGPLDIEAAKELGHKL